MTFCEESVDDKSILDADLLVHAVHPKHWAPILGTNTFRVASPSFNESRDGTGNSVNLWTVLQAHGLPKTFTPAPLAEKWKDFGFVEFAAAIPRSESVKVVHMPLPEEDNPAHAVMCGISDGAKALLSRAATILSMGKPR